MGGWETKLTLPLQSHHQTVASAQSGATYLEIFYSKITKKTFNLLELHETTIQSPHQTVVSAESDLDHLTSLV